MAQESSSVMSGSPPTPSAVEGSKERAHTPGPWGWYGSTTGDGRFYLATVSGGRRTVMSFRRSGTQSAQPEFQEDGRMVKAAELVRFDVAPHVKGKSAAKVDSSVYRQDFSVIDHPDARLIASAPELLESLTYLVGLAEMRGGNLHEYKAALDDARAAIRKSTGGA